MLKVSFYGDMSVFENIQDVELVVTDLSEYSVNEIKTKYPDVKFLDINTYIYSTIGKFVSIDKFQRSGLLESNGDLYLNIVDYLSDISNPQLLDNMQENTDLVESVDSTGIQVLESKIDSLIQKVNNMESKFNNQVVENKIIFEKLTKHV